MSVNVFRTITSAIQFVDFCKKLDIRGGLSDSDLETLYSYADENGYNLVLVDNYSRYTHRFYLSDLLFTFFDYDTLKDLALEIGISEDLIGKAKDSDELSNLIEKQDAGIIDEQSFASIVDSFLPADQYITPILSNNAFCFLVMHDSVFEQVIKGITLIRLGSKNEFRRKLL